MKFLKAVGVAITYAQGALSMPASAEEDCGSLGVMKVDEARPGSQRAWTPPRSASASATRKDTEPTIVGKLYLRASASSDGLGDVAVVATAGNPVTRTTTGNGAGLPKPQASARGFGARLTKTARGVWLVAKGLAKSVDVAARRLCSCEHCYLNLGCTIGVSYGSYPSPKVLRPFLEPACALLVFGGDLALVALMERAWRSTKYLNIE
ncbi:hypothetical protein E5D57_003577 [Metarhizium anisopliae]|nr:hypothetical protein E5D57_003577 [Metarhizium anisopliae]